MLGDGKPKMNKLGVTVICENKIQKENKQVVATIAHLRVNKYSHWTRCFFLFVCFFFCFFF